MKGEIRLIFNVRLRPGKDDCLENWYKKLPEGDRSRIIRNILKANTKKGEEI